MIIYENARFGANYEMEIVNPHVEDYTISHFHRSYEFIYIYKGELVVALDDENVTLHEGEYILIFPKQIHSFRAKGDCDKLLVMFSPDYIYNFYQQYKDKLPEKQVFPLRPALAQLLAENLKSDTDEFMLSACMYAVCSELIRSTKFHTAAETGDLALTHQILTYVENNFRRPIKLSDIAQALGYNYHYLCRECSKLLNTSFSALINSYRLDYAANQLIHSDEKIITIAYNSGFDNIRTFNRNFLNAYKMTPLAYRKNHTAKRA